MAHPDPRTPEEWVEDMRDAGPSTPDDRILTALNRHEVDYLVVGGAAANLHGATRVTLDFDCVPETSLENLDRLAAAMRELNARLRVAGRTTDPIAA